MNVLDSDASGVAQGTVDCGVKSRLGGGVDAAAAVKKFAMN